MGADSIPDGERRPRRETFAMVPPSIIRCGLDAECKVLYAHLDPRVRTG